MENSKSKNIDNLVVDLLNRNFEPADIKDYLLQKGYPEGEIATALSLRSLQQFSSCANTAPSPLSPLPSSYYYRGYTGSSASFSITPPTTAKGRAEQKRWITKKLKENKKKYREEMITWHDETFDEMEQPDDDFFPDVDPDVS
jgi:hypothetical protein